MGKGGVRDRGGEGAGISGGGKGAQCKVCVRGVSNQLGSNRPCCRGGRIKMLPTLPTLPTLTGYKKEPKKEFYSGRGGRGGGYGGKGRGSSTGGRW